MDIVRTRLHHLPKLLDSESVYWTAPKGGLARVAPQLVPSRRDRLLRNIQDTPKFVLSSELCNWERREEYHRSVLDIKRAGLLKMPFEHVVVEVTLGGTHYIATLSSELVSKVNNSFDVCGHIVRIHKDSAGEYLVVSPTVTGLTITERDNESYITFSVQALLDDLPKELIEETWKKDGAWLYMMYLSLVTVLITQGVSRQVIECAKLNKRRVAANKPPIPKHTYVHIGRVYRSASGNAADAYIPRRSPRPHWRRGHLKGVRFGAGREQIRRVFIPPRLVACVEDTEPPNPEYRVLP